MWQVTYVLYVFFSFLLQQITAGLSIYNHSQEILRQAQNIPTPLKISSQYPVFPHVQLRISHPRKTSLEYPSLLRLAQNASLFFRTVLEYSYPSKLTQRTASFLTTCSDYSFTTQNQLKTLKAMLLSRLRRCTLVTIMQLSKQIWILGEGKIM